MVARYSEACMQRMRLIRNDIPENVRKIIDKRCEAAIWHFTKIASDGTFHLDEMVRSCYWQGFQDAFDAATKKTE
jgi:hypothetical protein